ncbi:MAG: hypothetical protein J5520_01640 [Bacteroidales bacterium]|nr:hypothetical protein [Bacteroidales bacterium]
MKRFYRIAEFTISLEMPESAAWDHLSNMNPFQTDPGETIFSLEVCDHVSAADIKPLYFSEKDSDMAMIRLYTCAGGYMVELAPLPFRPIVADLFISDDFKDNRMAFRKDPKVSGDLQAFAVNNALMLIYSFRTSTLGALEFHSSITVNDGKGYLFLGKSGTGKSTHSSLWLKHIPGSYLLNDDNPVVRVFDDGSIRVFGTPWSGKTPCYKQESVPVGAIVRISQSPENRIHRNSLPEAYASVMASTSGFKAIKPIADGMHASIATLVSTIPCYTLDCRPDKEAAELCHKTVSA